MDRPPYYTHTQLARTHALIHKTLQQMKSYSSKWQSCKLRDSNTANNLPTSKKGHIELYRKVFAMNTGYYFNLLLFLRRPTGTHANGSLANFNFYITANNLHNNNVSSVKEATYLHIVV